MGIKLPTAFLFINNNVQFYKTQFKDNNQDQDN